MKKFLCRIGIHKYTKLTLHPFKGNWVTRQCKRCGMWQDRRLF